MNWNFYWRRPFGSYQFLWMALGLFSLTILLVTGAMRSIERDRWLNHTLEVLQELERYEGSMMAAQVLTSEVSSDGNTNRALSRERAEKRFSIAKGSIERLLKITDDNPRQAVRVRVLRSLTDQIINLIRGRLSAPTLLALSIGNVLSDFPLVETINEIRMEERTLLERREKERQSADNTFWLLAGAAILLNLLMVWWTFNASRRYIRTQNEAESNIRVLNDRLRDQLVAIRDLNGSLEDRVNEKTNELHYAIAQLASKNQQLERFAHVASHDMQEPLRQVVSFNNLLSLKYGDHFDEDGARYLQYSIAGAKRLQMMLRGLLQYTSITPESVHPTEVAVAPLMETVLDDLRSELTATAAIVVVNSAEGLTITGDLEMLRTVVLALVSNAIKFRDRSVPASVQVAFHRGTDRWTLTVTDNGIGIDERFAPKVFEMFARYHPIGEHPGAGVGLALSRRIVDCHGGTLSVHPNPEGAGSVFVIEVPVTAPSQKGLATGRFPY